MSDQKGSSPNSEQGDKRSWVEEIEISGNQLLDRVKQLVRESNARRVVIFAQDGEELMSIPLTFGVVAGGLITLSVPLLAALGALAAVVTRVRLQVIREEPEDGPDAGRQQPGASESTEVLEKGEEPS